MGGEKVRLSAALLATWFCFPMPGGALLWAGEAANWTKNERKAGGASFEASLKDPIFITSDRMEVDRKKNTITYRGRVVALQGEMTMRSEALTAYYNSDMKGIREVIAEGNVQVAQGDRVATGAKAIYLGREQTVTLMGNPVVRQGNSQISGSRIIFFINQDRAVVEGGSQRVKATIFPDELESRENRADMDKQ